MAKLEVLSPAAQKYAGNKVRPASRLESLNGKTIGLYWNQKSGGDVALARIAERLSQRHPGVHFKSFSGSIGWGRTVASEQDVQRIAQECQAVIGATAD